jgi:hypothetical protein
LPTDTLRQEVASADRAGSGSGSGSAKAEDGRELLGTLLRAQLPAANNFGLDDEQRVVLHEPDSTHALDTAKAEPIPLAARA